MSTVADCFRRVFWIVLLVALHVAPHATAQPRVMPQPALLPHYSPLCDSNLFGCLDIDDFGAHAYAHLMVLPGTDRRDAAAVFPYGVTLAYSAASQAVSQRTSASGRRGGGIVHQHGPLRLNLTALLWPLLPLEPSAADVCRWDGATTYYRPAQHLRIGLHYEQQVRVGPFQGANALGLLTDLAALRMVASANLRSRRNHDQSGRAVRLAWSLRDRRSRRPAWISPPVFRALKLYGEAFGPRLARRREDEQRWHYAGNRCVVVIRRCGHDSKQSVLGAGPEFSAASAR